MLETKVDNIEDIYSFLSDLEDVGEEIFKDGSLISNVAESGLELLKMNADGAEFFLGDSANVLASLKAEVLDNHTCSLYSDLEYMDAVEYGVGNAGDVKVEYLDQTEEGKGFYFTVDKQTFDRYYANAINKEYFMRVGQEGKNSGLYTIHSSGFAGKRIFYNTEVELDRRLPSIIKSAIERVE